MKSNLIAAIALLVCLPRAAWTQTEPPVAQEPPVAESPLPAAEMPTDERLFAPFSGKSPCGEFDSPYNNFYGDTRTLRSVVLGRLWTEMEYLAWASKPTGLPALVSTSPLGTDPADAGILGPTGSVLFGDETIQNTLRSGARLNFGYWFTPEHLAGVETRLLWLNGEKIDLFAAGGDDLILATPFTDADTGLPGAVLISFPGLQDGEARVRANTQLFGLEVLGRHIVSLQGCSRMDVIGGYRYLRLDDTLRSESIFLSLDPASGFDADTIVARIDAFRSKNDFHGGEFGLVYRWWNCCWAVNLTAKAALGGTRTLSRVSGRTVEISPTDEVTTTPGGIFAAPSNIGDYERTDFSAVGDVGIKLEYAFGPQLRLTLGYNWMGWSNIARIGDRIDTVVDPTQIPPSTNPAATRPGFAFQNTSFWSHGLTFGGYYDF